MPETESEVVEETLIPLGVYTRMLVSKYIFEKLELNKYDKRLTETGFIPVGPKTMSTAMKR